MKLAASLAPMKIILCAAAILVIFSASVHLRADPPATASAGAFIQAVGHHTPAAGLEIEVFDIGDRFINYKITFNHRRTVGPTIAAYRKDLPWFFYAASSSEVWFHDGSESVLRIQFAEGSTRFTDNHVVPELLRDAPLAVRDHLPERLRRVPQP